MRRRIMVFGVAPGAIGLLVFGIVVSLSGGHPGIPNNTSTTTTTTLAHPHVSTTRGVGVMTLSYEDRSRETYNYTTGRTTAGRVITAEVRYETARGHSTAETPNAPILRGAAHPVIVFAPGYRHRAEDYEALLDDWVNAGYVVVTLGFPDTAFPASDVPYRAGLPHGIPETDMFNEPSDVAYVLSQLAVGASDKSNVLHGVIDPARVFLAGHSDGATVIAAFLYDANNHTPGITIRASAIMSGAELPISGQNYGQPSTPVPMLVVQSAADRCNPPDASVALYNAVAGPKYFLELLHASHVGSYDGTDTAATAVVAATTTAFFDIYGGTTKASSAAHLAQVGTVNGVSTLTGVSTAAAIPTPAGAASCPAD